MDAYKFIAGLFGFGFLAMVVMANLAFSQRDEALRFRAEMGATELVCRVVRDSK